MSHIKIVTDSSANLTSLPGADFAVAPLKIHTAEREFVDTPALDVPDMLDYMAHYKGRSQSSCPNVSDWISAFGESERIICVTLTGSLSGSYNAARSAGEIYEAEHPGRRVFVLDTLSAGPEVTLVVEQLRDMVASGRDFDAVCTDIRAYLASTGLCFMLKSLHNFANNGRVSVAVAKIAGLLGLCIVGRASTEGTLEPTDKCRGEARSFAKITEHLARAGFSAGRVILAHSQNAAGAQTLKEHLLARFPQAEITISENRGLCSFYAEVGGILVGYEKR